MGCAASTSIRISTSLSSDTIGASTGTSRSKPCLGSPRTITRRVTGISSGATIPAKACRLSGAGRGAGGWVRLVALHRRIGHRHGHGDQFSGTRDILLAGGAGEQPVATDAVEPLWQDMEQEAPDELVGGERHGAQPRPAVGSTSATN